MATAEALDIESQLADEMILCERDPYRFVMVAFPWGEGELAAPYDRPEDWQIELLKAIRDELISPEEAIQLAVASGHGIGKSAFINWLVLWAMATWVDTVGVVTANTEAQLRTKTWRELKKWHRLCIVGHWFEYTATSLYSKDPNHQKTWRVDMIPWSEHKPDAFAGLHNKGNRILLIFDEASSIPDNIWEVSEGALTDEDTVIIWMVCGNPTQSTGRFRECFRKFKKRWITRQIDSRTVRITNKKQIQKWIDDYGVDSDFVKVRVRGMFPVLSSYQFISAEDVDKAFGKHLKPEQYAFAPKILTCDPAWTGDDELVIGLRQGLVFQILKVLPKNDNDLAVANMLARFEDEHRADAVFIDGGFGTGIISAGRTMNRNWQIVWFSEKPNNPGYINKRAEMWGEARVWLKEGGAIPEDQTLYSDLTGLQTVPRPDGKIQLESKEQMKERGLPSPNRGDSLALSFAHPVVASGHYQSESKSAQARRDYNPRERRSR